MNILHPMANLERTHLAVLRAIDEEGSLTAAGRSLGLSQSALSHTIRKLESDMGVEIYQREGRRLRLTPAGEYLLAFAARVLPQFERTEQVLAQFAKGSRGSLRIGIECHPCYRWLLRVVSPYIETWPDVDVDVKQRFQFGGVGALYAHDIDLLITPDPLKSQGLSIEPVFDYEHVLVVAREHRLANQCHVCPADLQEEILLTYPVEVERLDVYSKFLLPAGCLPKKRKVIETTDILLKLVECGRGVSALPRWLLSEYQGLMDLAPVRLGPEGMFKQIALMMRALDTEQSHIAAFVKLAASTQLESSVG